MMVMVANKCSSLMDDGVNEEERLNRNFSTDTVEDFSNEDQVYQTVLNEFLCRYKRKMM